MLQTYKARSSNMISIITPAYRAEKYIGRCIESVKKQIYQDYEHLIIIQGNTDNTRLICQKYASKDKKIKLFYTSHNSNLCKNRNIGLDNACGQWVTFLDADDEYEPFFLSNLLSEIETNNQDIVLGQIVRKGKGWRVEPKPYNNVGHKINVTPDLLKEKDVVPFYIGIYKKSLFDKLRFDEKVSVMEDWLFLKEAFLCSKVISYINSPGYLYWDNGESSLAWDLEFDYNKHLNRLCSSIYTHLKFYDELRQVGLLGTDILISTFNISLYHFSIAYKKIRRLIKEDINKENNILRPYLKYVKLPRRLFYRFYFLFPILTIKLLVALKRI